MKDLKKQDCATFNLSLWTITLMCLLWNPLSGVEISTEGLFSMAGSIKFERNLLIFEKVELPVTKFQVGDLPQEFEANQKRQERLLEDNAFAKITKQRISEAMTGGSCSPHYAKNRFFRNTLTHRIKKILEDNNFDAKTFGKELKKLGDEGDKFINKHFADYEESKARMLKLKKVSGSLEKLGDLVVDGIRNRLKKGVYKSVKFSFNKLTDTITKNFELLCTRSSLIERSLQLRRTDFLVNNLLGRLPEKQSNETKTKKEHLMHLKGEADSWQSLGALTKRQAHSVKKCLSELLDRMHTVQVQQLENRPDLSLSEVNEKLQEAQMAKESLGALLDELKGELNQIEMKYDDEQMFMQFAKEVRVNSKYLNDFDSFHERMVSFFRSKRDGSFSSADQANRIIDSSRKLYLEKFINEKKFNFNKMLKGIIQDIHKKKNLNLYWSFFQNMVNKNIHKFKRNSKSRTQESKMEEIKEIFEKLYNTMNESIAMNIIPKKFGMKHYENLKKATLDDLKWKIMKTKNVKKIKEINVYKSMKARGLELKQVDKQSQSYRHVYLTNLLNVKNALNDRYLKRCKRMFSKQRSMQMFRKKGFYLIIIKMFFESHQDLLFQDLNIFRTKFIEYLETLEYFKFLTIEQRRMIMINVLELIIPFIDSSSKKFKLDDFYSFYNMVINREEPIDYSGDKDYKDWPDKILLEISKKYSKALYSREFQELKNIIVAYKDSNIVVKKPDFIKFIIKHGLKNPHKMETFIMDQLRGLLTKVSDSKLVPQHTVNVFMKLLISMLLPDQSHTIIRQRAILRKILDKMVKTKGPPAIKLIFKKLEKISELLLFGFKSQSRIRLFGAKVVDKLIVPEMQSHKFALKSNIFTLIPFQTYMGLKVAAILRVIKDMKVEPKTQVKVLIKSLFQSMMKIMSGQEVHVQASMKKVYDELVIPNTPYTKFLIKTLLGFQALIPMVKQETAVRVFQTKFVDEFIKVEPAAIKYLYKQNILNKEMISDYTQGQFRAISKFVQDMLNEIKIKERIAITAMTKMNQNYVFSSKAQFSAFLKKMKDLYFHIQGPEDKFLIKALTKIPNKVFAAKKSIGLNLIIQKFRDRLIKIRNDTKFLVVSLVKSLAKSSSFSSSKLSLALKKYKDNFLKVNPNVVKFLIKAVQRIVGAGNVIGSTMNISIFSKKIRDNLIHVDPGLAKFLIKSLTINKAQMKTMAKAEIHAFFEKLKDEKIKINEQEKFLIGALIKMISKLNFSSEAKVKFFMKKFKDVLIRPNMGAMKFLIRAILQVGSVSNYTKQQTYLKVFMKGLRDYMIHVEPGFIKFLLKSQLTLKHTSFVKKIFKFKAFWNKYQDFLLSPLSWEKFLLTSVMFNNSKKDLKRLVKMHMITKKVKDYFIYMKDPAQKFLLTAFYSFMKNMSFLNMNKIHFYLEKFVDALNVPTGHQKFLLQAFMKLARQFFVSKNMKLKFMSQKFLDRFIAVDIPGKFLVSSIFKKKQVEAYKRIMKVKAFWVKMKDYFLTPMVWNKFLLYSFLFTKLKMNTLTTQQLKLFLTKMQDYHILVEPNTPKFLIQSLYKVMNDMHFFNWAKVKMVLKKFTDNLLIPEAAQKFLIQAFTQILQKYSVTTTTSVDINYKRLWDYYITINPQGKFLVQSQLRQFTKMFSQSLVDMRAFWVKMQDFLISPLSPGKFLLTSVLLGKGVASSSDKQKISVFFKKIKDFYNLIEPGFVKFLLSSMIEFMCKYSFQSKVKLHFFLKHLVDAYIITDSEKKFLISSFMGLLAPAFKTYGHLTFKTMYRKYLDNFISIPGPEFLLQSHVATKYETTMENLIKLEAKFSKLRDFFISPLSMDKYLIMAYLMNKSSALSQQIIKMKYFASRLQDFHILVQPGFMKFLLQSLIEVSAELHFHSTAKLHFFLQKFVDQFIQPEIPNKFLVQVLTEILTPGFSVKQKINFKLLLKKYQDYMIHVQIPGKFLIQANTTIETKDLTQQVLKMKGFWEKFQDFLNTPEPINKFLLTSLILTSTDDSAYRTEVAKMFAVKLRDYYNLVEPAFIKFLIVSLTSLLRTISFSSKTKVRFFLKKFVDSFILPETETKFLIKALMEMMLPGFSVNGKIQIKGMLKKFIDQFIPVEVPGKFLVQSELRSLSTEMRQSVFRMKQKLLKMQDFFISPLSMDQFLIFSLIFNKSDPHMKQAIKLKLFSEKLRDYHILVDLPFKKFLITALVNLFSEVRYCQVSKMHFMLQKFIDSFNIPEIPGKFLVTSLFKLMSANFSTYQKYEFSASFKKLLDYYILPKIPGKFLIQAQTSLMTDDVIQRVENFKLFLEKIQDFLIIPMTNQFMLFSLIAFKDIDFSSSTYQRFFLELKKVRDFHILVEPGFVKFLLFAVMQVAGDIHFRSLQKVHFFLKRVVDQFITVEGPQKFLIKYLFQLASNEFSTNSKLNLHLFLTKMTDYKIDPEVPGKFLLQSEIFQKMNEIYHAKIMNLRIFFKKLQDYFLQPVTFEKFLLQSVLELKLNDLSFVKTIAPKIYFKVFQDYHNIIEPNVVMFLMHTLMQVAADNVFQTKASLKMFLSKFMDMFIQVSPGIKFLEMALINFFQSNFQISTTKLSIMCKKYIDNYIQIEPQMKFLLMATTNLALDMNSVKKLHLKFLYQKINDEKNEISRWDKFYIQSYLQKHGIDRLTFENKLTLFNKKMRDYYITINVEKFLIHSLLTGDFHMEMQHKIEMKAFYEKLKDEYNEATPYMVIFLLKGLMTFFGDMVFKNTVQMHLFLKQYVDAFYDILAKNTMSLALNMFQRNCTLVEHKLNFHKLFKKLKMEWLFRDIRNVNMHQEHSVYRQFLQYFNLDNRKSFEKTKMGYLWRAIRGVNINNIITNNRMYTTETHNSFIARLYNLRMRFVKKGFGFSLKNKKQMKVDLPEIIERQSSSKFCKKKVKTFFKVVIRHIEQESELKKYAQQMDSGMNTILGKTRIKMFDQPGVEYKDKHGGPLDQQAHFVHDMVSKTLMKTLSHEPTEDLYSNRDKNANLFKSKKNTLRSLDKLYLKTLNVQQGTALQSDHVALGEIASFMENMQVDLKKTMYKTLSFEERPKMTKRGNMSMKSSLVSQGLKEMDHKLKGIGKILLNLYVPGRKSKRVKMLMHQLPTIMKDIKDKATFQGFQKLILKTIEPPLLVNSHRFHALYTAVNSWLGHSKDYDPTDFMKVILLSVNKPGNKETDKEPSEFYMKMIEDIKDILHKKKELFEPTSKAMLNSINKPGNKETDKEVLLKKMMGTLIQTYIHQRGRLEPMQLGKILIKNFAYTRVYHPLFKKAVLKKFEKAYPIVRNHMINLPVPQAKVLLLSMLGPGNKMTDFIPKEYKMKSLKKAQDAFHILKMTVNTAKKVLLKGECKCCCEYYIIYNFEECQSYEETAEDYIIDKAMHKMEQEGDKFTDYEMFDAIVDQIERQDFRCESGPRNMLYNILPDVKITLGVKRFPGSMELEPQELTETKDIKKIIRGSNRMYDIDTDFIDKMVKNNMAMDPKNNKRPRKNNYFDSPEYQKSSHLIDFLDNVYNVDPDDTPQETKFEDPLNDMDDLKGKDFHEEHEQTRNERIRQYKLDAEKIPSDQLYQRLLKDKQNDRKFIKLDDVHLLDQKPLELSDMEETIDKL
jgi:hypothetical protein